MLRSSILSFSLLLITTLFAQAQGSISGVVKDATTAEAIVGANVVIQGTAIGATTDLEGKFTLAKVAPGTYTIQITFITYKAHVIQNVVVEDAKKVHLEIPLAEDVSELTEIVVQAQRQTDTDFELLRAIKDAKLVVSGVSAQQISRTLDRDAAQVMRRVPGVTIKGNEFVQVRGLSERYNAVMLHNTYAPSVETDIRSFSFAIIPSSQLDRMLVYKSPSADLPGDFAGGVVKIFTKSIPEDNSIQFDYSTQVRAGTTFQDFYYQPQNPNHWTGFNNGYYDLPANFPKNLKLSDDETLIKAGKSLRNLWTPEKKTAIPDQRFTLTFNRKFKIGQVDVGNITALNYSNAYATYDISRSDYNQYNPTTGKSPIYDYTDTQYNQYIRAGVLFNWAFRFNDKHVIEFKNLYNQSSNDQYVSREGIVFENGTYQRNGSFDKVYRGIYSGQLLGTHQLFDQRTTVEWVAGYNKSYREQPDYKRFRSDVDLTNGDVTLFVPASPNLISPDFLGRFFSKLDETSYSGGASIKQRFGFKNNPLLSPEVKVGVFFEQKDRTFNARNIGFARASSANFDYTLLNGTIGNLFQPQNINNTTGIQIGEQSNPNDNYTASNRLLAYYLMTTWPISKKFNVEAGVRIEDNIQKLNSRTLSNEVVDVSYPVTRALPSANISYNFTEKMLIKATYGETLNRPEFRELAPFSFYDFNYNFTNDGNPYLKVAKIQNFDLRWEYYPASGESITVGGFYKSFTDPIETVFEPGGGSLGAKSFTYLNAKGAKNYGVEIEVKKSLRGLFTSKLMDNLSLLFNTTLIKSKVELIQNVTTGKTYERPLQGQAPYVINTGLFYDSEASGWQVNILYNVVGKSIFLVGFDGYPDLYLMPRNILDLTFNKRIGEHWQIKGGVSDILNQKFMILQDGNQDKKFDRNEDQVIQSYKPGQVFSLGFSVRM